MRISYIFIVLFIHTNLFASSGLIRLSESIPSINDEIIFDESQKEIQNNYLSNDTLRLVKENSKLRLQVDSALESSNLNYSCKTDPTDPKKKKKKKKKKKTKIKKGWTIISSVEVNADETSDKYKTLQPTQSTHEYNQMYNELKQVDNKEQLAELVKRQTKEMSEEEYISYLSQMTKRIPYNRKKASLDSDHQQADSLFSMLQDNDLGGICGDIHFATTLLGESSRADKYDFYTASYMTGDNQHVYAFAVDKENPDSAFIINYDTANKVDNIEGSDSLLIRDQGSFNNFGANLRIFKNSDKGSDGQSKHIATLPTPLGRFLNDIHLDKSQQSSIPSQTKGVTAQIDFKSKTKKIIEKNGKTKTIDIEKGVKFVHGRLQNPNAKDSQIFTLLAYNKRSKNLDEFGNLKDTKKLGSESNTSLSTSSINNASSSQKYYYVRFNYFKNNHIPLISSDKVIVKANIGYNINADYANTEFGSTGDANIETRLGLSSTFKIDNKTRISANAKMSHAIGLNEEREWGEIKSYPGNLRLTNNSYQLQAKLEKQIGKNATSLALSHTGTQVGSFMQANLDYQINSRSSDNAQIITVNYTKPQEGLNLLGINEQISAGYGVKLKNVEAGAIISRDINASQTFFGGSMKFNIDKKKKKRKPAFSF